MHCNHDKAKMHKVNFRRDVVEYQKIVYRDRVFKHPYLSNVTAYYKK